MKPAEDEGCIARSEALLDRAKATDDQERNRRAGHSCRDFSPREKRLEAIQAAKARLEARQREADQAGAQRRRWPPAPPPSGWLGQRRGSYKREFGVPDDRDQESFTDPDSRIMKHAGGGSGRAGGYTAVDAEHRSSWRRVDQLRADDQALLGMLAAVQVTPEKCRPRRWRMRDSVVRLFWQKGADHHGDVIVALGAARDVKMPRSMPDPSAYGGDCGEVKTEQERCSLPPAQVDRGGSNGWIKAVMGCVQFNMRELWTRCRSRVGSSSAWR